MEFRNQWLLHVFRLVIIIDTWSNFSISWSDSAELHWAVTLRHIGDNISLTTSRSQIDYVTAWCSRRLYRHFTLAHHRVSSGVWWAPTRDHWGSWVQIPSGARIFPSSHLTMYDILHVLSHNSVGWYYDTVKLILAVVVTIQQYTNLDFIDLTFEFSKVSLKFWFSVVKRIVRFFL